MHTGPQSRLLWAWGLGGGVAIVWLTWNASDLGANDRRWAIAAVVLVSVLVTWALPVARALVPAPGVVLGSIAVGAAAVYLCVPETNDQMPLVAFVLAVMLLAEVGGRTMAHIGVHVFAAGLVLWSGIYGATGRASAIAGALFAMWPVVIVAVVSLVVPRIGRVVAPARWLVIAMGGAAAIVVARTGALEPSLRPAVKAIVVCAAASLAVSLVIAAAALRAGPDDLPVDSRR